VENMYEEEELSKIESDGGNFDNRSSIK
jgi:hypothetical protein